MKKLLTILISLCFISSLFSQRSDKDSTGYLAAYKYFLNTVLCEYNGASSQYNYEASFPFDANVILPIPGFGINGKVKPAVTAAEEEEINYANVPFQTAIAAMSPEYLRFPGGTISSGYQLCPRKFYEIAGELYEDYFLTNADAEATLVANSVLFNEGATLKNETFLDNFDGFTGQQLNEMTTFLTSTCSKRAVSGPYQIQNGNYADLIYIVLEDFIDLTLDQNISPLYVLRMFDPLKFVVDNENGTVGQQSHAQVSPLLLNSLQFTNLNVDDDLDFFSDNMDDIRDELVKTSRAEIKRQLVKYAYSYVEHYSSNGEVPETLRTTMDNAINSSDIKEDSDSDWDDFLLELSSSADFAQVAQGDIRFDLGNETWDMFMFKYFPLATFNPGGILSNSQRRASMDPALYGTMSANAIALIDEVFPSAQIGVVGGARRNHCQWDTVVENEISLANQNFDAWVYHYYSGFTSLTTNEQEDYLGVEAESYLSSPIVDLASTQFSDALHLVNGIPSKNVWYTEFNVRANNEDYYPGSWFNFISKWKLINQYWSCSQAFKDALTTVGDSDLDQVYNASSPSMSIDLLLMQTLSSTGQSAILPVFENDILTDFKFLDQGLFAAIVSRAIKDSYDRMTPLVFKRNTSYEPIAYQLTVPIDTEDGACNDDQTLDAAESKVWGWTFLETVTSGIPEFSQLIVNGSRDCVSLEGIEAYDQSNVDLFIFAPPGTGNSLPVLTMNGDLLDFIQNVNNGGVVIAEEGFAFHTGNLNGVDNIDLFNSYGNIVLPPYAVLVLHGEVSSESCGGLVSAFLDIDEPPFTSIPTGTTTWTNENYQVYNDITIPDGASLIIDGGSLMMDSDIEIIVEQGGYLEVLGGAVITSCGDTWDGISVQGDPDGQWNNPGRVFVHGGATIEHAKTGLANFKVVNVGGLKLVKSGGLIQVNDAIMKNNKQDVEFAAYQNEDVNQVVVNDLSYFARVHSTLDDEYRFGNGVKSSMLFKNCNGMQIQGCEFRDLRSGLLKQQRRFGIKLANASVRMQNYCASNPPGFSENCNYIPNKFLDLHVGFSSVGVCNSIFHTTVRASYFDCWAGIMLVNTLGDAIWNNTFEVDEPVLDNSVPKPSTSFPVGIYMSTGVDDYSIEGNNLYGSAENEGDVDGHLTYGIGAMTANVSDELIYRNNMHDLMVGFQSINKNRINNPPIATGLELHCNTFSGNAYDISVMQSNPNITNAGIKSSQGGTNAPTFNAFATSNVSTVTINNEVNYLITYHYEDLVSDAYPYDYNGSVDPDEISGPFENNCDNTTSIVGGSEFASLMDSTNESNQNMMATQQVLDQMVDGGNSAQLQNVVILSQAGDEWVSYVALMNEAGYVSDEVLEILSSKEQGFTLAQIRDVLVANSHSASNTEVDSILNARSQQLPQYMRNQIKQGLQDISPLQYLRNQVAAYKSNKDRCIKRMVMILTSDSLNLVNAPTLESIYALGDGLEWQYKLLELYHSQGRSLSHDSLKLAMENELTSSDLAELSHYSELRASVSNWAALDSIPASGYDSLFLYLDFNDRSSSWAKSILIGMDSLGLDEPLLLPSAENKRLENVFNTNDALKDGLLELFPNPAQDYFTVSYRIDKAYKRGEIRISNQLGQVLLKKPIRKEQDQVIVRHGLEPGFYMLELNIDGIGYRSSSIIIR